MKILNLILFLICLSKWGSGARRWVESKTAHHDPWKREKEKKEEEELKKLIMEALIEDLSEEKEKLIAEGRVLERRRLQGVVEDMVENEFS